MYYYHRPGGHPGHVYAYCGHQKPSLVLVTILRQVSSDLFGGPRGQRWRLGGPAKARLLGCPNWVGGASNLDAPWAYGKLT